MKTRSSKRTKKSSQGGDELVDENAGSLVLDENSGKVLVQDKMDETVEKDIKDDAHRVIAVIDKNPAEGSNVEDDNDDDVPEDVSWKTSKETAFRGLAREKESLLDSKRKEKQMRIERNERLREQKERKRAREFSRLPMEVLQHVAKQQDSQEKEEVVAQTVATGDHVTFDSSSEDESEEEIEEQEEEPAVKVLVLSRETKKPKKIQQSASLFLQEHLFGDRIQRISSTKYSDNRRKGKGFAPSTNFSKKSPKFY